MNLAEELATYLNTDEITASIYIRILGGNSTKEELSVLYEDYSSRLEFLYSRRLVMECPNARKTNCTDLIALNPDSSLQAILLAEAWSIDSNLHTIVDVKELPVGNQLRDKYRLLMKLLIEVKNVYVTQTPYGDELLFIVKGINQISTNIATQISEANSIIHAMLSPPQLLGEVVWASINSAMERGVEYHRITEFREIPRHGFEIMCREVTDTLEKIYILQHGVLPERFYVIDRSRVIFFDKNMTTRNYKKQIEVSRNAGLAGRFLENYQMVLERTIPFVNLISNLVTYRSKIEKQWRKKYEDEEIKWLLDVFNYGVFYSKQNYEKAFVESIINKGILDGTLSRLKDGNITINYTLDDVINIT